MVRFLRFLSKWLFYAAVAVFLGGFAIILINGSWPESFAPVQNLFQWLHGNLGALAYLVQIAMFAGPSVVTAWLADQVEERQRRRLSDVR